ncbi:hypothetical protein COU18_02220 [Candidatus Kaiserbacteria bacterium CG10_big_fil_rev_8_21_14_0_10_51_14]|uniref:Uncharacterized protein n=1 Tax=Candidatus Kaiserbacteria bacterium CG10_big_fil_rev_8_21_14_0_10_51_14 TaxID=1974610 RepID=A0A2H0UBU3_9BACT|nr:MAG: hypothetical protein COU18_02220 [Candidatus Kaiserbacteria bacterium CG10_big_fil_rev_8_21_14_0_10_51_14]
MSIAMSKKIREADIRKLARDAAAAAKIAIRNRFLIETFLSVREALEGKTKTHASAAALFKKLNV